MTREEAIRRLEGGAPFSELYDEVWENALIMAIESLKAEPINHGQWVIKPHKMMGECPCCSVCGSFNPIEYNYCPNCGADMREVNDETD